VPPLPGSHEPPARGTTPVGRFFVGARRRPARALRWLTGRQAAVLPPDLVARPAGSHDVRDLGGGEPVSRTIHARPIQALAVFPEPTDPAPESSPARRAPPSSGRAGGDLHLDRTARPGHGCAAPRARTPGPAPRGVARIVPARPSASGPRQNADCGALPSWSPPPRESMCPRNRIHTRRGERDAHGLEFGVQGGGYCGRIQGIGRKSGPGATAAGSVADLRAR
jgi:hypothetical protein